MKPARQPAPARAGRQGATPPRAAWSVRRYGRPGRAGQMLAGGQGGNSVGLTGAPEGAARLPPAHSRYALPAETHEHAGQGDMYAFLGVKGSRVRIPPSRPERAGQKGFRGCCEMASRSSDRSLTAGFSGIWRHGLF
jgi:hypothetical protein